MNRTASRRPAEKLLQLNRGELLAWEQPQAMPTARALAVWCGSRASAISANTSCTPATASRCTRAAAPALEFQAERDARLIVEPVVDDRPGPRSGRGRLARPRWLQHAPVPAAVALGAP